ncbi:unnamed protein product [Discosporangium mesarthrocarpum]
MVGGIGDQRCFRCINAMAILRHDLPFNRTLNFIGIRRGLERRLKSRIPRERGEGIPEGRRNLKLSEEDYWQEAGVYDYYVDQPVSGSGNSSPKAAAHANFARLVTIKVAPEKLEGIVNFYKKEVAPILQVEGFVSAHVFTDGVTGMAHSLSLWQSQKHMDKALTDPNYSEAMIKLGALLDTPPQVFDNEVACTILPTTGGGDAGDTK